MFYFIVDNLLFTWYYEYTNKKEGMSNGLYKILD